MGANATIFIFDYALYRELIVPTFLRLMCEGVMEPWLQEFLRTPEAADWDGAQIDTSFARLPDGFTKYCTYIDSELAARISLVVAPGAYDGRWTARACRDDACELRSSCVFHITGGDDIDLDAAGLHLLERIIVKRCLGQGQFLGRSIDCSFYWGILDHLDVPSGHPIRQLLGLLGRRGRLIGYGGSADSRGIHGWLSPDETEVLAGNLFSLSLPEYEYSFARMRSFNQLRNILDSVSSREFPDTSFAHPTASFEELSLSFLRTVCVLAAREGKGVLWGNSVS